MKFFRSRVRFRHLRNPSSASSLRNALPDGAVQGCEDDFRTAETSSECNVRGGDDGYEMYNSGRSYDDAVEASSSSVSASSVRVRVDESDVHSPSSSTAESVAVAVSVPEGTGGKRSTDTPPVDDCCPICFSAFVVPCRAPCGHWYCGGCILQYWDYGAALQPCICPMCSSKITSLAPEASLLQQEEADVTEVLKKVQKYNRLFVGGIYGFFLKVVESPLYLRRMCQDMVNPDRPGAHLSKMRIIAMVIGLLYAISPFDFLHIGRQNVIDVFDYSAMALSFILYLVGLYLRRRRLQRFREMAAIQL